MSNEPEGPRPRVAVVTEHAGVEQLVREILATTMPSTMVERLPLARAVSSDAGVLVVDEATQEPAGAAAVAEARARGFAGPIVLLAATCDPALEHRLLALGPARCVVRAAMGTGLPDALAAVSAPATTDDDLGAVERELRRTQQLVVMGEATSRIQHTLNNPLTALLAEAQLLEMEELTEEHRAAVKRMIELCRRMVGMVRSLDPGPR